MSDETRLRLLSSLVVLAAATCVAWAIWTLTAPPAGLLYPAIGAALIAVGNACSASVPIRAGARLSFTPTAVLVCAAVLPPPWVILCAATGVTTTKVIARYPSATLHKALHNVGKDILCAAAAAAAMTLVGVAPSVADGLLPGAWSTYLLGLCLATAAILAVQEAVTTTTISLATGRTWAAVARHAWDIRMAITAAELLVAAGSLTLLAVDNRLMIAMPLAMLVVYRTYAHRLHLRAERHVWQRLAALADALHEQRDLTGLLHTAVRAAIGLFGAAMVDVELTTVGPPRLVRADNTGEVRFDGPPEQAPAVSQEIITQSLNGHADNAYGVFRMRLPAANDVLSDRELSTARAYCAALTTSIDNALAYAQLTAAYQQLATESQQHVHDATHDFLTGLANRRHLLQRLATQLESGTTALLYIDLDGFKPVNDTLGHPAGDQLLVEVADRLRKAAEPDGYLVARLGGDEFAVMLTGATDRQVTAARAERILSILRQSAQVRHMAVAVRASAGLAHATPGITAAELLRRADMAMYAAKHTGAGMTAYEISHDTADPRRLALGIELHNAIAGGEITLQFQPIVDLATGAAVAAEARACWRHPRHGLLPADQWQQRLSESSTLLTTFTEAVIHQALAAAHTWRQAGLDLAVAVPLPPRYLPDLAFVRVVLTQLHAHDVKPTQLILHLSETIDINDLAVAAQAMAELRMAGIRLVLDDFGTGHSSLPVLSHIAVDMIRLSQAFVHDIHSSNEAAVVAGAAVRFGCDLKLAVVADGIENYQQRHTLWTMGCTLGQGSLFGGPMITSRQLINLMRFGVAGRPGQLAVPLTGQVTIIPIFRPRQMAR